MAVDDDASHHQLTATPISGRDDTEVAYLAATPYPADRTAGRNTKSQSEQSGRSTSGVGGFQSARGVAPKVNLLRV